MDWIEPRPVSTPRTRSIGVWLAGAVVVMACSATPESKGGEGHNTGGAQSSGGAQSGGVGGTQVTTGGSGGTIAGTGGISGGTGGLMTGGAGGTGGIEPPPVVVDDEAIAPLNLIPIPGSVTIGTGHVHLSNDTRLVGPVAVHPVAEVLAEVLRRSTGFAFPIVNDVERRGDIVLEIDSALTSLGSEGYELEVESDRTRLRATSNAGLFYATVTLRQLLPPAIESTTLQSEAWRLPRVSIEDKPRFEWRGLSFDVARHFYSVEEIRRFIDLAAYHKLNRFHLHLTDDQGWRIFIDSWPNLATHGGSTQVGGGTGGYFTKADYASLASYAAERFVTVVPEIDMPGHTNAALASYGQLNPSGNAAALYTGTGVGFSSLWLGQQVTIDFVDDVLGEVAAMTPGPYLHIGGDEAHETDPNEYNMFIDAVEGIVQKYGKTMVGWCEVGNAAISSSTIVQHWYRDYEQCAGTVAGVQKGAKVIFSYANRAYPDQKYDESTPWGHDWAGPVNVQAAYEWSPSQEGVPESSILGVEAAVWTEFIEGRQAADRMIFPRLCGHAEIGWSPAEGRKYEEYRTRLAYHGQHLEALGVDFHRSPMISWIK